MEPFIVIMLYYHHSLPLEPPELKLYVFNWIFEVEVSNYKEIIWLGTYQPNLVMHLHSANVAAEVQHFVWQANQQIKIRQDLPSYENYVG